VKSTIISLFTFIVLCASAFTQEAAIVVVYSSGSSPVTGAFGSIGGKKTAFQGWAYMDGKKIGLLTHDRFIALRLPPGNYSFGSTNGWTGGIKGEVASITVEPGKRYFIRAQQSLTGLGAWSKVNPKFSEVKCEDAQKEGAKSEPVKPKRLKVPLDEIFRDAYFPACESQEQTEASNGTANAR
jgi:hypothetical protein